MAATEKKNAKSTVSKKHRAAKTSPLKASPTKAMKSSASAKSEKMRQGLPKGSVKPPKRDKGKKRDSKTERRKERLSKKIFESEVEKLSAELVRLQAWIKHRGLRLVVVFEGRDAAGKGGIIKTITAPLNPRGCRIVALGTPTEREKTQWYFQRYVEHLPAAGEMVLFDRSWYNRAGVERVMGFCTTEEYDEFLVSCPEFERMLVRSGIILVKYWFSVSDDEQERRFRERAETPTKRWKLSPMDLEARARWVDYSKAKDAMFDFTDQPDSPWWVVEADDKRRARLNCIKHLLARIDYEDVLPKDRLKFPPRQKDKGYRRPPMEKQRFVPELY